MEYQCIAILNVHGAYDEKVAQQSYRINPSGDPALLCYAMLPALWPYARTL